MTVIDLFAGAGGWDLAARQLGLDPIGVEYDEWACATRAVVGFHTIRQDVRTFSAAHPHGRVEGLIASPPCPEFSTANNKRSGLDSPEGRLTLEPLRVIRECMPRWVAMEQVPGVLPIWQGIYATALRDLGYDVDARILCAADYGTPQTRRRAILIARLDGPVAWPAATHAEAPGMFGELPWVSMADALGWPTDQWAGFPRRDDKGTSLDGYRDRDKIPTTQPAPAPTEKGRSWMRCRPATTVQGDTRIWPPGHKINAADIKAGRSGHDRAGTNATRVTISELGVLQDFPANYPWQGSKTRQARQVGNAIPVQLARAVLAAAIRGAS